MSFAYPLLDAFSVYKQFILPALIGVARIDRRVKQTPYESEVYVSFRVKHPKATVPGYLVGAHDPFLVLELTNVPNYDLVASEEGFGGHFFFKGVSEYVWIPWESLQRFQDRTAGVFIGLEEDGSVCIACQPAEKPRPSLRVVPSTAPPSNIVSFPGGGRK